MESTQNSQNGSKIITRYKKNLKLREEEGQKSKAKELIDTNKKNLSYKMNN